MKERIPTFLTLLALAAPAVAIDIPSVERGKELFSSTQLGTTNGKSCASCHQNGKNLQGIGEYDDARLAGIVNHCIMKPLKGVALDPASDDLKSLVLYLRTFERPHHE